MSAGDISIVCVWLWANHLQSVHVHILCVLILLQWKIFKIMLFISCECCKRPCYNVFPLSVQLFYRLFVMFCFALLVCCWFFLFIFFTLNRVQPVQPDCHKVWIIPWSETTLRLITWTWFSGDLLSAWSTTFIFVGVILKNRASTHPPCLDSSQTPIFNIRMRFRFHKFNTSDHLTIRLLSSCRQMSLGTDMLE